MKPLSPKQKSVLIRVALQAHARAGGAADFDEWRRDQVLEAVDKAGLRDCNQDDYCRLMGHFLDLAGQTDQAFEWLMKADGDDRRQSEFALRREMLKAGIGPDWVEDVCRDRFGCQVDQTSPKQLIHLAMHVKAAGLKKRQHTA